MTRLTIMGHPESISAKRGMDEQVLGSWVIVSLCTKEGMEIEFDISRDQATALIPQLEKAARK